MKKRSGNKGLQIVSFLLVLISFFVSIVSLTSMIGFGLLRRDLDKSNLAEALYHRLMRQYACEYLVEITNQNENSLAPTYDGLEGGPWNYAVEYTSADGAKNELVYGSEETALNYDLSLTGGSGYFMTYDTQNLWAALIGSFSCHPDHRSSYTEYETGIESYVYNTADGCLYAYTEDKKIFPVKELYLSYNKMVEDDETDDNSFSGYVTYSKKEKTYVSDYESSVEIPYEALFLGTADDEIDFDIWIATYDAEPFYQMHGGDISSRVRVLSSDEVTEGSLYNLEGKDLEIYDDAVHVSWYEEDKEYDEYTIYIDLKAGSIDNSADYFKNKTYNAFKDVNPLLGRAQWYERWDAAFFGVSFVILIISLIVLFTQVGYKEGVEGIYLRGVDKIPYFLSLCFVAMVAGLGIAGNIGIAALFVRSNWNIIECAMLFTICYLVWMSFVLDFFVSTVIRIKAKAFWKTTLLYKLLTPFRAYREHVEEANTRWWVLGGFIFITLVEFIGLYILEFSYRETVLVTIVFLFVIYKIIELVILMYIVKDMLILKEAGNRIARGDYSKGVPTAKMFGAFKKHGENLNHVSEGIAVAVEEQMKSERFQTELITNVSHDIKTPLTSIINYVDLIKKEKVEDETLQEYIEVLDRQSSRLKKLIEDLIEASKASSGTISVNMETIDAVVMLDQVIGEFQEKLEANGLEVVVNTLEPPVEIMADGRHFWRILDNLMGNVCKYAQPGTRVYVDMEKSGGWVQMTFRNISKDKLNISADELKERFVRGDESRNTEGHGLGLNIAESLANLMNGNLHIEIDGDLFKVKVFFPEAKDEVKTEV